MIDTYNPYVSTIVYNIIGVTMGSSEIEEIVSDTFYILWINAHCVQRGKVKAYLAAVARNKAKEYLRKCGREVPLEEDIILVADDDPAHEITEQEQARFLREAVLAMPFPEWEIFYRYYYYYQPVAAIAEEMGINLSTVKTKLHRGRKKLKEILIKGGYPVEN